MGIGKNIQKRMEQLGWKQRDLVAHIRQIDSDVRDMQQIVHALIHRDSASSKHTSLIAAALQLTADELISGRWNNHRKPDLHNLNAQEPAKPYGISENALLWAREFDKLDPKMRRRWWLIALLLADDLSEEDAAIQVKYLCAKKTFIDL